MSTIDETILSNDTVSFEDIFVDGDASKLFHVNSDGSKDCLRTIKGIQFIFTHVRKDTFGVTFSYNDKVYKNESQGKIFVDSGIKVKNSLINSMVDSLHITKPSAKIICDELWKDVLSTELSDLIFSVSVANDNKDAQYLKPSDALVINVDDIAFDIMKSEYFITFEDTKVLFYYDNGIYIKGGEDRVESLVRKMIMNYASKSRISEVVANIKSRTLVDRDTLDLDLNIINLRNGMFNIETSELMPHSPKYQSIRQLPFDYNTEARCPQIEKFMGEVLPENDIITVYEAIGYAMIPKTNIAKSTCFFVGTGSNGKSIVLNVIKEFIGGKNVSGESLQSLEENKFATSSLYGKLLNVFADLSSKKLYDNSIFKTLTGNDSKIRAERKFIDSFEFDNTARLMFAANKLPPVPDEAMFAFFRRMMIFSFENKFEGINDDKNILEKLTTEEELSGLFNIVIESLRTVLDKDDFTYDKSLPVIESIYRMHSDDVFVFMNDKVIESDTLDIPKSVMYKRYEMWCNENKLPVQSTNKFTRRLNTLGFTVQKRGERDSRKMVWLNCKFTAKEDNDMINTTSQSLLSQVPMLVIPPMLRDSENESKVKRQGEYHPVGINMPNHDMEKVIEKCNEHREMIQKQQGVI